MTFGMFGAACVLGIAAIGSSIGLAIAGTATIGSWKRSYMNNKPAPFVMVAFAGAPLTQTIYGYLLMNQMLASEQGSWFLLGIGVVCGLAIASSAVVQGMAGAAGADSLGETGKGFAQYITVVGLCETVALFVMVFGFISV